MHWIIDRIISGEPASEQLLATLQRRGDPVTLVRKVPFTDYVVSPSDDEPIRLDIDGPVFVSGSTGMSEVAANYDWTPGYIDAPGMDEAILRWGGHMLNATMTIGRIDSIPTPDALSFIRPVDDGKSFAGTIMYPVEFEDFRTRVMAIDGWTNLPPETLIATAPLRHINSEWRCLIVDGQLITGSRYRSQGKLGYVAGLAPEVSSFAQDRAMEWSPRRAFIMDIAITDEGLRVIETNSVSSAGFYAMDIELYIEAIGRLA